jgi:cytochrome oxidase assembly protein ShyY1
MSAVLQQAPPPARSRHRFAFLVKPGWLGAIAGALAFTAACWLILAPWQFSRNTETSQTNAGIETAHHATPVPLEKYLSTARQPAEESVWQPVTATGTFLPDRMFYVRLRQDDGGNPVSEVVLPMRLTDGTVLLVDRGTRSILDIGDGSQLPPVPAGVVTVTGRVQQDQTDPRNRKPGLLDGLNQAYAVNANDLAGSSTTPGNVRQGYIQLMAGSPGVLDEIGMPQTDSGPYLSYALQWCAFGAMSLLAIGYFIFREATDPRGPDERNVPYPARGRLRDDSDRNDDGDRTLDGDGDDQLDVGPMSSGSGLHADTVPATLPVAAASTTPASTSLPSMSPAAASVPPGRTNKKRRTARDGFDRSELFD